MVFGGDAVLSTKIPVATSSAAGVMSTSDKTKLDGIAEGANAYSHPAGSAPSKAAGFYKISTDAQSHVASVTNVTKDDITKLGIPATNTTYDVVTTSANGLMSAADKKILDYYNDSRGSYLEANISYSTDNVSLGNVRYGVIDDIETNPITLSVATTEQAGVMSAADKTKLDGIVALTNTEIDAILAQ